MEFLDDLRRQRETGKEPEEQRTETPRPVSPTVDPAQGEAAWNELLTDTSLEKVFELPEEPTPKQTAGRRGRRGTRLSRAQKITLGVLGLLVVLVWGVIILIMSQSMSSASVKGDLEGVVPVAETTIPTVAPSQMAPDTTPSPTLSPTPTATPGPAVSTRFDIQIERDLDNVDLYVDRGREYLSLNAYEAGRGDFQTALDLQHGRVEAHIGLGWASFYLWDWDDAQLAFETALLVDSSATEAHFGLGQIYFYRGAYAQAAKHFDQAAEINPQDAVAESWLTMAAAQLGQVDEAHGGAARALAQNPHLAVAYVAQSWARRVQSPPDIDGAQGDLLYAQQLEPNSFLTLNALAQFYVSHRPERVAEAERLAYYAQDWAANEVERVLAQQTLGEVFLAQGRKADAQQVLSEAADRATWNGEILLADLAEDLARARE